MCGKLSLTDRSLRANRNTVAEQNVPEALCAPHLVRRRPCHRWTPACGTLKHRGSPAKPRNLAFTALQPKNGSGNIDNNRRYYMRRLLVHLSPRSSEAARAAGRQMSLWRRRPIVSPRPTAARRPVVGNWSCRPSWPPAAPCHVESTSFGHARGGSGALGILNGTACCGGRGSSLETSCPWCLRFRTRNPGLKAGAQGHGFNRGICEPFHTLCAKSSARPGFLLKCPWQSLLTGGRLGSRAPARTSAPRSLLDLRLGAGRKSWCWRIPNADRPSPLLADLPHLHQTPPAVGAARSLAS